MLLRRLTSVWCEVMILMYWNDYAQTSCDIENSGEWFLFLSLYLDSLHFQFRAMLELSSKYENNRDGFCSCHWNKICSCFFQSSFFCVNYCGASLLWLQGRSFLKFLRRFSLWSFLLFSIVLAKHCISVLVLRSSEKFVAKNLVIAWTKSSSEHVLPSVRAP